LVVGSADALPIPPEQHLGLRHRTDEQGLRGLTAKPGQAPVIGSRSQEFGEHIGIEKDRH
jgi:hypothetical protein